MNLLMFFILVIETYFLVAIDKKIWGTYYTPITIVSIPFLIVLIGALLFAPSLGYFPVYWKSILVWVIALPLFWLPGLILGYSILKTSGTITNPFSKFISIKYNHKFIIRITLFLLIVVYIRIVHLAAIYGLGTKLFSEQFGRGFAAHSFLFLRFMLIYYIVIVKRKNTMLWIIIILILIASSVYGSKSWLFIPILAGLIVRMAIHGQKTKISLKLIISLTLFIFIVFFLTYYGSVGQNMKGGLGQYWEFLIKHIATYFFAGILGLSEFLKSGEMTNIDPKYVIGAPVDLVNFIFGNKITASLPSNLWIIISNSGQDVNVHTLFGMIYIYSGTILGILYTLIFGSIYYMLLSLVILKKNIVLFCIYTYLISFLLMGWFCVYFKLLAFYEVPLIGIMIYLLTQRKIILGKRNRIKHEL